MLKTFNVIVLNSDGNNLYTGTEIEASNKEDACRGALMQYIEILIQSHSFSSNRPLFPDNRLPNRLQIAEVVPTQYEIINLTAQNL